jgi:hypothetical protein
MRAPGLGGAARQSPEDPGPTATLGGALLVALALSVVSTRSKKTLALGIAAFLAASALVLFVRKLLLPFAFFHQNGIGPSWIDVALILFAGLMLDPVLVRVAHSESYFGIIIVFGCAAATLLLCGARRPDPKSATFVLAVLASGLFVAQAARVHPIGWVPLALVPLVVLLGPGLGKSRLLACAVAGLGIAIVVAVTTGPALWAVVHGTLGAQWMHRAGPHLPFSGLTVPFVALSLFVAWLLGGRRGWTTGAITFASLVIGAATNLLSEPNPWVHGASLRLQLPVLGPVAAMWVDRLARRRAPRARFAPVVLGGGFGL